jgi:hypothetical protein
MSALESKDLNNLVGGYLNNVEIKNLETLDPKKFDIRTNIKNTIMSGYDQSLQIIELYNKHSMYREKNKNIDIGFVMCLIYTGVFEDNVKYNNMSEDFESECKYNMYLSNKDLTRTTANYLFQIDIQCHLCNTSLIMLMFEIFSNETYPNTINYKDILDKFNIKKDELWNNKLKVILISNDTENHPSIQSEKCDFLLNFADCCDSVAATYMRPKLIHTKKYTISNLDLDIFYEAMLHIIDNWKDVFYCYYDKE